MIEKKHPYFSRKLSTVVIGAIIFSGLILCNIMGIIKPQLLPTNTGILLGGTIILSALVYGFWIGNHVKCPECSTKCEHYSDEINKSRKVICPKCQTVWNLETSYNTDTGG
jgi:hypothetical protein